MLFLGKFVLFFPKKRLFKMSDFPSQYTTIQVYSTGSGRDGRGFDSLQVRSRPPASYCPCLPSCFNTPLCKIVRLLRPPPTAHIVFQPVRIILGHCFGTPLSVATLGENNFGEQLWGAILRLCCSIDKQTITLKNERQLWGVAQKAALGAAFGSNFRAKFQQLWRATIILEAALGNSLVEKLCGAALGSRSSFEEQLCAA